MNSFGEVLKSLRVEKDLTQEQLAKELKISRSTLAYYETGNRRPDFDTLQAISKYFNVSIDYLLGQSDQRSPQSFGDGKHVDRILHSLARANELDDTDLTLIADQIEKLIEYAEKKKRS